MERRVWITSSINSLADRIMVTWIMNENRHNHDRGRKPYGKGELKKNCPSPLRNRSFGVTARSGCFPGILWIQKTFFISHILLRHDILSVWRISRPLDVAFPILSVNITLAIWPAFSQLFVIWDNCKNCESDFRYCSRQFWQIWQTRILTENTKHERRHSL